MNFESNFFLDRFLISQAMDQYSEKDNETWFKLCTKNNLLRQYIAQEYINGLELLNIDKDRIACITELSKKLETICGWRLVPVSGLLPPKEFFHLLRNNQYPVTIYIRSPSEIDFSESPDIFHDIFGHLPLLANEDFSEFLNVYSMMALKYVENDQAMDILNRLYWFTYEMGLIKEGNILKSYGGAIITSAQELRNVQNANVFKHPFDLDHIFQTSFDITFSQKEYFFINSFNELFEIAEKIEGKLITYLV